MLFSFFCLRCFYNATQLFSLHFYTSSHFLYLFPELSYSYQTSLFCHWVKLLKVVILGSHFFWNKKGTLVFFYFLAVVYQYNKPELFDQSKHAYYNFNYFIVLVWSCQYFSVSDFVLFNCSMAMKIEFVLLIRSNRKMFFRCLITSCIISYQIELVTVVGQSHT